ncbi:MAG: 4Fe-4S ferredoxin [Deltaproteobacteria bacterium]|nr:4Fe-4S ferredoxin [Deltaproteobacteria bacterium]
MCQFCHQHGEGKTWYLKAEHYAEELLADLERRRYLKEFIEKYGAEPGAALEKDLQRVWRLPAWLRSLIFRFQERRYRRDHFGQVVPREDLARVLELAGSIIRLPCICRKSTKGRTDAEYCIGLGLDPEKLLDFQEPFLATFRRGPDAAPLERLTPAEALDLHRSFARQGLIHTLWTFKTPFIGAICNCDRADCLAMLSYRYQFRIFFRGEYVAEVKAESCSGCRACLSQCQFGALGFSLLDRQAFIDPIRCYGCGICREPCEMGAIRLIPRSGHPLAGNLW